MSDRLDEELVRLLREHVAEVRRTLGRAGNRTDPSHDRILAECQDLSEIVAGIEREGAASLDLVRRRLLKDWQSGIRRGLSDEAGLHLSPGRRLAHERGRRLVKLVEPLVEEVSRSWRLEPWPSGMARVQVVVHPKSSRKRIETIDGVHHVWLTAVPVDGAANEQLVELIAEHFAVPPSRVRIASGRSGRRKVLEIHGPPAS